MNKYNVCITYYGKNVKNENFNTMKEAIKEVCDFIHEKKNKAVEINCPPLFKKISTNN